MYNGIKVRPCYGKAGKVWQHLMWAEAPGLYTDTLTAPSIAGPGQADRDVGFWRSSSGDV